MQPSDDAPLSKADRSEEDLLAEGIRVGWPEEYSVFGRRLTLKVASGVRQGDAVGELQISYGDVVDTIAAGAAVVSFLLPLVRSKQRKWTVEELLEVAQSKLPRESVESQLTTDTVRRILESIESIDDELS